MVKKKFLSFFSVGSKNKNCFIFHSTAMNGGDELEYEEAAECCVCMATDEDDGVFAMRENGRRLASLYLLPDDVNVQGGAPAQAQQVIFASACCGNDDGEAAHAAHALCSYCLHRLATSFGGNHPIGARHPMIPCPYPFGDCLTPETGLANYFPHTLVERVLTDAELVQYRAHVQRYQFPGFELVQCPRPSRFGTTCGAGILVSLDDIHASEPGSLVMRCDQSQQCQRQTCYHCRSLVHRARSRCDYCITSRENTNERGLNHYFYRPDKVVGDGQSNLLRNDELTLELVVAQIVEMAKTERLETRCTECLTFMFKTEMCNTLEHCGVEKCYSCGRSGTRTQKLGDHWDSNGFRGCPRFDYSTFWNVIGGCKFRCLEGDCYGGEVGDCDREAHTLGIQNMIRIRKKAHIYHAIKSLLPHLRQRVLDELWTEHAVIRPLLPQCDSSDYRTYVPECTRKTAIQAQKIISASSSQTLELARNIVAASESLVFSDYSYPVEEAADVAAAGLGSSPTRSYEALFDRFKSRYIKARTVKATK